MRAKPIIDLSLEAGVGEDQHIHPTKGVSRAINIKIKNCLIDIHEKRPIA